MQDSESHLHFQKQKLFPCVNVEYFFMISFPKLLLKRWLDSSYVPNIKLLAALMKTETVNRLPSCSFVSEMKHLWKVTICTSL